MAGPRVRTADIVAAVADRFDVPADSLTSRGRGRRTSTLAKHVAVWLTLRLADLSHSEIAERFGPIDETTVIHARKRIDALRDADGDLRDDVDALLAALSPPEGGDTPPESAPGPGPTLECSLGRELAAAVSDLTAEVAALRRELAARNRRWD